MYYTLANTISSGKKDTDIYIRDFVRDTERDTERETLRERR